MDTVHRKHGSLLRQLVWIALTCLVEFPTKSRGYGVWVVGVTKYAVFRFPPIQGYPTVGVAKYAVCRIKCFAPRRGYLTVHGRYKIRRISRVSSQKGLSDGGRYKIRRFS